MIINLLQICVLVITSALLVNSSWKKIGKKMNLAFSLQTTNSDN